MIDLILIFTETGILILKKKFSNMENNENEEADLISGFFSVVFQYFSNEFGQIQSIKTENKLILIKKFDRIYISLVINLLHDPVDSKVEKTWFANNRIEEIAYETLRIIEKKVSPFIQNLTIPTEDIRVNTCLIQNIDQEINELINIGIRKMEILREMIGPTPNTEKTKKPITQIYENI